MRLTHRDGRGSGTGAWGLKAGFKSFRTAIGGDDHMMGGGGEHHHYQPPLQRPSDAKYLIVDIIDEAESAEVGNHRKLSQDDHNVERDR